MTARERKELENLIEQKMLEFFGDPDTGLKLNKAFLARINKNMRQKSRVLTSHANVLKKCGLHDRGRSTCYTVGL